MYTLLYSRAKSLKTRRKCDGKHSSYVCGKVMEFGYKIHIYIHICISYLYNIEKKMLCIKWFHIWKFLMLTKSTICKYIMRRKKVSSYMKVCFLVRLNLISIQIKYYVVSVQLFETFIRNMLSCVLIRRNFFKTTIKSGAVLLMIEWCDSYRNSRK